MFSVNEDDLYSYLSVDVEHYPLPVPDSMDGVDCKKPADPATDRVNCEILDPGCSHKGRALDGESSRRGLEDSSSHATRGLGSLDRNVSRPIACFPALEGTLPTLPDEVIMDCIVIRLPAKSVGRFRCVSKPWASFLSSHQFARSHLNFHKSRETEGILIELHGSHSYFTTVHLADKTTVRSRRFNPPPPRVEGHPFLIGSCDGLVLVKYGRPNGKWRLKLFNPTTLETLVSRDICVNACGLGYDSVHDDYKVVALPYGKKLRMAIYSVRMQTWSYVNKPNCRYLADGGWLVNGSLHWLASPNGNDFFIAAFSMSEEEFTHISLPEGVNVSWIKSGSLGLRIIGGCIGLIMMSYCGPITFWVMMEYGAKESWTKYVVPTENYHRYVGDLGKDEILFVKDPRKLVSYNWRYAVWRNMVHSGRPGIASAELLRKRGFRESLISPKTLL